MKKLLRQFFKDSEDLFVTPTSDKGVKRVAMLLAIIVLLGASIGIPFKAHLLYYSVLTICFTFLMVKGGLRLSGLFWAFYIIIFLNVLIVDIPAEFQPFQRAVLFVIVTMLCSSTMETSVAFKFRAYLFRYLMIGIAIISVASFFCFFFGINLMAGNSKMMAGFENYASRGGWFSGLACHSNVLGPLSMLSALFFYFLYQKRTDKIYLILFFLSTMSAVVSSSRAALLGIVVAIIYNLVFGKVQRMVRKRMISILVLSSLLAIPIAGVAFKGLINKQVGRIEETEELNSRQAKFDYRIEEFKSSPIFGIGFCSIDINGGDAVNLQKGVIEPGTSHLAVLSMLGLVGFVVYVMILYKGYATARKVPTLHSRFVLSCFIAVFVHAWFEGYVLSAGGTLAMLFWLIIGRCIDSERSYKIQILKKSK